MRKYFFIFKYYVERILVYRIRILIWFFCDIVNFVVFPFIWLHIYGSRTTIADFTREDLVTYYIILALISAGFTSHISKYVREDIMKGDLNRSLTRPEPHFIRCYLSEIAYKSISCAIALCVAFVIWLIVPQYIVQPNSLFTVLFFALGLFFAFSISQFIEYIIGLCSFWLGETRALTHTSEMLTMLFAGSIAPLSFFPTFFQKIAAVLPFKFLGYIPAQIYLGQLTKTEIYQELLLATGWLCALGLLIWYMWRKGLKVYEGVGI